MPTVVHLVNPQPDIDACIFGYVYEDANANGVLDEPDFQPGSYDVQILRDTGGILENWQCYVGPDLFNFSYVPLNENLRAQFTIGGDWFFSTPNTNPDCNLDPWLTRYNALETYESLEVNGQTVVRGTSEDMVFQTVTGVLLPVDDAHKFDIGIYRKASFSDHLYHDLNQNGVQDAGEAGLAGVQVSLVGVDGYGQAVERSTFTDAQGVYQFSDLMPATYQLLFHVPGWTVTEGDLLTNWSSESDGIHIEMPVLLSGDVKANGGTGLTADTRIEGWVWYDDNHDGLQNDDLFALEPNSVVWLCQADGAVVASTQLDSNSRYVFTDLPLGTYYVDFSQVKALPGAQWTLQHSDPSQPNLDSDVDFLTGCTGEIVLSATSPSVLYQDAGIDVLAPQVTLSTLSSQWREDGEHSFITIWLELQNPQLRDLDLSLTFSGAVEQDVDIEVGPTAVQIPAGGTWAYFILAARTDNLVEGDEDLVISCGNASLTVTLKDDTNPFAGSRVSLDANGNGVQDEGEPSQAGVSVYLLDVNGAVVDSAMTDEDGGFRFSTSVNPGSYRLQFVPAEDAHFTQTGQGSVSEDSDADASGLTQMFTVSDGMTPVDFDAGTYQLGSIDVWAWNDVDRDGWRQEQAFLAGAHVTLLQADGVTEIASATTDAGGRTTFDQLTPGFYQVRVDQPFGWQISPQQDDDAYEGSDLDAAGMVNWVQVRSGDGVSLHAGFYTTIVDRVWRDDNMDGVQDEGEPGLNGVTVNLVDAFSNDVIDSTSTQPDGSYRFAQLTPGTYRLQFELPSSKWGYTLAGQGTADTDSDADGSGLTSAFQVTSGADRIDMDAGLICLATFEDTPDEGAQLIDLDIDSDNQDGLNLSQAEEDIEDQALDGNQARPGKILLTNELDFTGNRIPDFADGITKFTESNGANRQSNFTPMVLTIAANVNVANSRIRFVFDNFVGDDPNAVTKSSGVNPIYSHSANGKIRIWMKNGNQVRNVASVSAIQPGDFVPAGVDHEASRFFNNARRTQVFFIEGINESEIGQIRMGAAASPGASQTPIKPQKTLSFDHFCGQKPPFGLGSRMRERAINDAKSRDFARKTLKTLAGAAVAPNSNCGRVAPRREQHRGPIRRRTRHGSAVEDGV